MSDISAGAQTALEISRCQVSHVQGLKKATLEKIGAQQAALEQIKQKKLELERQILSTQEAINSDTVFVQQLDLREAKLQEDIESLVYLMHAWICCLLTTLVQSTTRPISPSRLRHSKDPLPAAPAHAYAYDRDKEAASPRSFHAVNARFCTGQDRNERQCYESGTGFARFPRFIYWTQFRGHSGSSSFFQLGLGNIAWGFSSPLRHS